MNKLYAYPLARRYRGCSGDQHLFWRWLKTTFLLALCCVVFDLWCSGWTRNQRDEACAVSGTNPSVSSKLEERAKRLLSCTKLNNPGTWSFCVQPIAFCRQHTPRLYTLSVLACWKTGPVSVVPDGLVVPDLLSSRRGKVFSPRHSHSLVNT